MLSSSLQILAHQDFGEENAPPAASDLEFGTDVLEAPTTGPPQKKSRNDDLPHSFAEGTMRTRMRDLLEMVGYVAYVPSWYATHTARGKWQEREIKKYESRLIYKRRESGFICLLLI